MVYVDSRNLGYKPYIWRWLNTRTKPGEAEALQLLFDRIAVPAIDWVCAGTDGHDIVKKPLQRVPHTNLNMMVQLCRLLDATIIDHPKMEDPQVGGVGLIAPCSPGGGRQQGPRAAAVRAGCGGHTTVPQTHQGQQLLLLSACCVACVQVRTALFVFCCVWSVGALVVQQPEAKDRDRFDALLKQLAAMGTVDLDRVCAGQLPAQSLYEYCFDVEDGCWRSWRSYVGAYVPQPSGQFSKVLVSTGDTAR